MRVVGKSYSSLPIQVSKIFPKWILTSFARLFPCTHNNKLHLIKTREITMFHANCLLKANKVMMSGLFSIKSYYLSPLLLYYKKQRNNIFPFSLACKSTSRTIRTLCTIKLRISRTLSTNHLEFIVCGKRKFSTEKN